MRFVSCGEKNKEAWRQSRTRRFVLDFDVRLFGIRVGDDKKQVEHDWIMCKRSQAHMYVIIIQHSWATWADERERWESSTLTIYLRLYTFFFYKRQPFLNSAWVLLNFLPFWGSMSLKLFLIFAMCKKSKKCIDTIFNDILCIFSKKLIRYYRTLNILPNFTDKITKEVVFFKKTTNFIKKFEWLSFILIQFVK